VTTVWLVSATVRTPPTGEEVAVAIGALRRDAAEWLEWADSLARAAAVAADLSLTANDMCALSQLCGLPDLYARVQQRTAELAAHGAQGFTAVAGALTAAADGYEADERNAVHRLRGTW
jgi:hypothetical protein